jgi:hypothetical protein
MNYDVALEIYKKRYAEELAEEQFMNLLERGLYLLTQNDNTDKIFINRFYKGDDLKAMNIVLEYNELLMVRLLFED